MPDLQTLIDQLSEAGAWIVLVQIVLVVLATFIALRFAHVTVRAALGRLFDREAVEGTARDVTAVELERRRQTLEGLTYRALRVIILIIGFLMVLQVLRLDIGPAIAGLGIVGLALSLGAQHLVRDYVAGAFVFIENQYSRGDVVTIAGVTGTVEDLSLRRTTLRDVDGTVHYVPHGLIQTSSNLTRLWAGINIDVPVPYEENLDRVRAAIDVAGRRLAEHDEWRGRVIEPPRVARIERLAEQGLVLRVFGRVAAADRVAATGELRRLVLAEATRRGLTIGWRAVARSPDARSAPDEDDGQPPDGARPDATDASGEGATIVAT